MISATDRVLASAVQAGRWLPKGRTTVHRALWSMLGRPERFFAKVDGHWFRVEAADRNIAVHTAVHGMWEAPLTAFWRQMLAPGMVVVDIGANKGYFSLLAATKVVPGGRVISFEPLPGNAQDIEATAAANGFAHWTVSTSALSSAGGVAEFFVPTGADGSGWGSLESAGNREASTIGVTLARFDDEAERLGLARVDLLKMDIQGHELEALRGAEGMLRDGRIASLLVEVHCHILGEARVREIWALMERMGYRGRYLNEAGIFAAEWDAIAHGRQPWDAERCLLPVQGVDDPVLPVGTWYKILWQREANS